MTLRPTLVALLLLTLVPPGVEAAPREKARKPPTHAWLGIGVGMLSGDVEVECADGDCDEGGLFGALTVNATVAGPMALRARWVQAREDTSPKPYEQALLAGVRVGRRGYLLLGPGRVLHADDDYEGTASGLSYEYLSAPRGGQGFTWSLQGFTGDGVKYFGAFVGAGFGG